MSEKKYYFLKLSPDFFNQKSIKKLRSIAGGDTYTIIYLKMQLKSLDNNGRLFYEGFEDSFEKELALEIDEQPENVEMTVAFLIKHNLIEIHEDNEVLVHETLVLTGQQLSSTERVRRHRELKKKKALQCNNDETLQNVSCNVDIEIDIETDKEKDTDNTLSKVPFNSLLEKWNSFENLSSHKESTWKRNLKSTLVKKLKTYDSGEIEKAIENYAGILASDLHRFSYSWTLWDFLSRGLDRFLDESKPWERERIRDNRSGPPGGYEPPDNVDQYFGKGG